MEIIKNIKKERMKYGTLSCLSAEDNVLWPWRGQKHQKNRKRKVDHILAI